MISMQCSYVSAATFLVSTYGAHPNDNNDDTNAIQLAINRAVEAGPGNIVLFQSGTYNIRSPIGVFSANKLTIMGQGMQQTLLLGSSSAAMFQVQNSQDVTITELGIDYDPLPFTAGHIVGVNSLYLDVQVVSPHKPDVGRQVKAILRYNQTIMRPAIGPSAYEIYQDPPGDRYTTLVSSNVLRIPLKDPTSFVVGDAIVARYVYGRHAIDTQDITNFNVRSVTIYTSWMMGIVALRAKGLTINNYYVTPRSGRWLSTSADCMHFSDCRNYITISNSKCEAQGDDGLNVHAFYLQVAQIISPTSLVITEYSWPDVLNVGVGTRMEFSSNQQPFTVYTSAVVTSTSVHNSNSRLFVFNSPISVNVGDWVSVADTPTVTVTNLTVANNRARGILIKTRHARITNSVFIGTSGPAIIFEPSLYWYESVAAQDVKLLQNVYVNCNEGIARQDGIISFAPSPRQVNRIFYDVVIEASTFLFGTYTGSLLQGTNAANVYIRGSYIATNGSAPLATICNSMNICAHNNTFVNSRYAVNPYQYDNTSPCRTDLSDLIGLYPSGFDSRFPPPVMATKAGVQSYGHSSYSPSFNIMDLSLANMIG